MAIIVASSVTKHGRTISGNIVEIVTVKVGPGYAPIPAMPGPASSSARSASH